MLRKKVFLYVSFVKSVQFVCAIINEKWKYRVDNDSSQLNLEPKNQG